MVMPSILSKNNLFTHSPTGHPSPALGAENSAVKQAIRGLLSRSVILGNEITMQGDSKHVSNIISIRGIQYERNKQDNVAKA